MSGTEGRRLDGKVAIVTGGAGLGFAYARRFVAEGARVVIADVVARARAALSAVVLRLPWELT